MACSWTSIQIRYSFGTKDELTITTLSDVTMNNRAIAILKYKWSTQTGPCRKYSVGLAYS